jgi:predicted DCC family thiol-disulfide oxidoreductase YuxK
MPEQPTQHPVILFDGECNLCNGAVQLVIRHDKKHTFRFAALQSPFGQTLKQTHNIPPSLDSFLLLDNKELHSQSTAALRVAKRLNGIWPVLYVFIIIPPFIRNGVYNFIARNRYKWFGKRDHCMIPTPELKSLFIDT